MLGRLRDGRDGTQHKKQRAFRLLVYTPSVIPTTSRSPTTENVADDQGPGRRRPGTRSPTTRNQVANDQERGRRPSTWPTTVPPDDHQVTLPTRQSPLFLRGSGGHCRRSKMPARSRCPALPLQPSRYSQSAHIHTHTDTHPHTHMSTHTRARTNTEASQQTTHYSQVPRGVNDVNWHCRHGLRHHRQAHARAGLRCTALAALAALCGK